MASKLAKQFLADNGITLTDNVNNGITTGNFAAGCGAGIVTLSWHIVRFDKQYGSSQETVDYATDSDVSEKLGNFRSANCGRYGYYARNIKTGELRR